MILNVGAYKAENKMAKKPSKRREALLKIVDATKTYGVDEVRKKSQRACRTSRAACS